MFKNILLVPSALGQSKTGVARFPDVMSHNLGKHKNIIKIKNKSSQPDIFNWSKEIYRESFTYHQPLNIGGDHSISIATGAASLNKCRHTKFIWIDAHADINTHEQSKTKNYHGMPLSFLTGLDKDKNFSFIEHTLPFSNILYIGIRDVDVAEWKTIRNHNILYIPTNTVNNDFKRALSEITKFVGNSPVHLSFDVDAIDPSFISTTGTPVKGGIHLKQGEMLTKFILDSFPIIGMDIVEMNLEEKHKLAEKSLINFWKLFPFLHKKY